MQKQIDIQVLLKPILRFYSKYRNWIIGIGTGLGLVILLVVIVVIRLQQTRQYALQRLLIAEGYLYQKNFNEGYKILDELISHYKNSKYAGYAMYIKASYLYENKDFTSAKSMCQQILQINKPKTVIIPTMYILGLCYMNLLDFNNAIDIFNKIVQKFTDSFYTPRVYEVLALCYEHIGDIQSAKAVYEKMNVLYPGSYWSDIAQRKLSTM